MTVKGKSKRSYIGAMTAAVVPCGWTILFIYNAVNMLKDNPDLPFFSLLSTIIVILLTCSLSGYFAGWTDRNIIDKNK